MKSATLFALLLCTLACMTGANANGTNKTKGKTYILKGITGDISLNGIMISKNSKVIIKGLSESFEKSASCIVAAGQYYPSANNKFGMDGNFITKVHLQPNYADKDLTPQCPSDPSIKKGSAYYFIALTGEGWYQMLYKGKLLNCLESHTFPRFKQPKIDEWFKVSCDEKVKKKIWIKLDTSLLENKEVCKLTTTAPDYGGGSDAPTIKGVCEL